MPGTNPYTPRGGWWSDGAPHPMLWKWQVGEGPGGVDGNRKRKKLRETQCILDTSVSILSSRRGGI